MEGFQWSSGGLPADKKISMYHELNSQCHGHWSIEHRDKNSFFSDILYRRVDDFGFTNMSAAPLRSLRTDRELQQDLQEVFCFIHVKGGRAVLQQGRNESRLHAGDFTIWDSRRPVTMEVMETITQFAMLVPQHTARAIIPDIDSLCGSALTADSPYARILASHFDCLDHAIDHLEDRRRLHLLTATLDLVGASFPDADVEAGGTSAELKRAQQFILDNIEDPELSVSMVAEALGCSRRHLHRIFSASDSTVSNWIRTRRLSAARRDVGQRKTPITEIALRYGFYDSAHFSRAFRQEFRCSPQSYRKMFRG